MPQAKVASPEVGRMSVVSFDGAIQEALEDDHLTRLSPAAHRGSLPMLAPRLRSFSFLQPVEALVAEIDAFAPTIISTYPSAAVNWARAAANWALSIAATPRAAVS